MLKDEPREIPSARKSLAHFYAQPAGWTARCLLVWRDAKAKNSRYLDVLFIHIQQSLAEVHADGGLHPPQKLSGAHSVCEAGLPHPGVPDHHNLECPVAAPRWGEAAAQRTGKLQRRFHGGADLIDRNPKTTLSATRVQEMTLRVVGSGFRRSGGAPRAWAVIWKRGDDLRVERRAQGHLHSRRTTNSVRPLKHGRRCINCGFCIQ